MGRNSRGLSSQCHFTVLNLYVLSLLFNSARVSEADCNGVMPSESRPCVCINQDLIFNCTISGMGITEWSGTSIGCPDGIFLLHSRFPNGTSGSCGQITARSIGVDNGCYSSQLTTTATAALNSTYLQCVHNVNGERNIIGTVLLTVISGPPEQPRVSVYVRQEQLIFFWNRNNPDCSLVDYSIISNNCGSCVLAGTSAMCSNFPRSTVASICSFSIRSMACGFSQIPTNPTDVTIKVPDAPLVQDFVPIYTAETRALTRIAVNISQEAPFNITGNISGSVLRYSFYTSSVTNPIIINTSCEDQVCEYIIDDLPTSLCSQSTRLNITVAAANAIGQGPRSQLFNIECANEFVDVVYNADTSTIACSFFSSANYSCSITYRLCQDTETRSNTSKSNTIGSNQVLLQIYPIASAQYCYVIIASNNTFVVMVNGTFSVPPDNGSRNTVAIILGTLIPVIFIVLIIAVIIAIVVVKRKEMFYKVTIDEGGTPSEVKTSAANNNIELIDEVNQTSKQASQPHTSDAAEEKPFEQRSDSEIEKAPSDAESADGGDSDSIDDLHEEANQRDTTYTDVALDIGKSTLGYSCAIVSSTASYVGSGADYISKRLWAPGTEPVEDHENPN